MARTAANPPALPGLSRLRPDRKRLNELRDELGTEGLASVFAILAGDIAATLGKLVGALADDRDGVGLGRAEHRWIGTLAQFGFFGHAARIRQSRGEGSAAGRLRTLLSVLDHANGLVAGELRQPAVNHRIKESPLAAAAPPPG